MAVHISIVVPVLNEAEALPSLLAHLKTLEKEGAEVVLVDGGSEDATAELAQQAGFRVVDAPKGRALQMNAGATQCAGEILLFLHADTRLPPAALALVRERLHAPQVWGRFNVHIPGRSRLLPVIAWAMNLRSRLSGIATGDQAMFVARSAFLEVGGFPELALMEDIALSAKLKVFSPPLCLRAQVTTSGRRWDERGAWRTVLLMWRLRWAYWRGVPAAELARAYR